MSYALSFASAFFVYVAPRLPLPLFNGQWSSPSLDLVASLSVAVAPAESQVVCAAALLAALSATARP